MRTSSVKLGSEAGHTPIARRDMERETHRYGAVVTRQMTDEEREWVNSLKPPEKSPKVLTWETRRGRR